MIFVREPEKAELDSLRVKVLELEDECDEVRQRSMKGNLIISSPNRDSAPSLGIRQQKFDIATNTTKLETEVNVCVRMILQKTGVAMPVSDVVACHPLGNRRGAEKTYILRVINRKPGSAWDSETPWRPPCSPASVNLQWTFISLFFIEMI